MSVLLVDNYDSFTHNLAQYLGMLHADVTVVRNDAITLDAARRLSPSHIVISPGPGHPQTPRDFGVCGQLLQHMSEHTPTLGVCLGHQGIAAHFGASIVRAPRVVHGKSSVVTHDGAGVFSGLKPRVEVMRYHSLAVDEATLPESLVVTARAEDDGVMMALRHRSWPLMGVQFHPESIGTPDGLAMLKNFLTDAP
ncbi:MAG: anthranilate synthase component 2 [Bradymonadia bacterium]|jgi:anthranilate synthase component 2